MTTREIIRHIEDKEVFEQYIIPECEVLVSKESVECSRTGNFVPAVLDIPFRGDSERHVYLAEDAVEREVGELEDLIGELMELAEIDRMSKEEVLGIMSKENAERYTNVFERG